MKEKQNAGLLNSLRLGAGIDNQQVGLADVTERFDRENLSKTKKEKKMEVKKRSRYDDLCLAASSIFRITEDGRLLRNEGVLIYFLELCRICKVKKDGIYIYAQNKGNSMVQLDYYQIKFYVLMFIGHLGLSDVIDLVVGKDLYFSPEILNALREESADAKYDNLVEVFCEDGSFLVPDDKLILESYYV